MDKKIDKQIEELIEIYKRLPEGQKRILLQSARILRNQVLFRKKNSS